MTADGAPRVSFVIPVFNEVRTIEEILLRVQAASLDKEIVIVDDGSTDGTRALLTTLAECSQRTPATMKLPQNGSDLRAESGKGMDRLNHGHYFNFLPLRLEAALPGHTLGHEFSYSLFRNGRIPPLAPTQGEFLKLRVVA